MRRKILCLFTLSVLLFLASCVKNGIWETDAQATGSVICESLPPFASIYPEVDVTAPGYYPDEGSVDYDGYEFRFLNSSAEAPFSMCIYIDPDMTGDIIDNLSWKRNYEIEKELGVTIEEDIRPYGEVASYARSLILSDEELYDVMYIPASHMMPLISEELFYDLLEIKDELGLENVWWDQCFIEKNTVENSLYYVTSDLHLDASEGMRVLYFNEDIAAEEHLEWPYDIVIEGDFTYDEFLKYCSACASLNGDSTFTFNEKGKARYGLAYSGGLTALAYGMGAEFTERDENGRFHFTADENNRLTDTFTKLSELLSSVNGLSVTVAGGRADGAIDLFVKGRSLFLEQALGNAAKLRVSDVNYGILPLPKYDREQLTYNAEVSKDCLYFCVPVTNKYIERTGHIVDSLTSLSYMELTPAYHGTKACLMAYGKRQTLYILGMLRNLRGCEAALPYGWTDELLSELGGAAGASGEQIASLIAGHRDSISEKINEAYELYPVSNSIE